MLGCANKQKPVSPAHRKPIIIKEKHYIEMLIKSKQTKQREVWAKYFIAKLSHIQPTPNTVILNCQYIGIYTN